MAQGFLARVNGRLKQIYAIVASSGSADAGKIIATDSGGRIDVSFMPAGIGANQVLATSTEDLSGGDFVNLFDDLGTLKVRKADNSNGRAAYGYVEVSSTSGATATVKRLNTINSGLTGLTPGVTYWLGVAGGVISTPLDSTAPANVGKIDQYLGVAKSATELVTIEEAPVIL